MSEHQTCANRFCRNVIPPREGPGRRARFCSDNCRVQEFKAKRADDEADARDQAAEAELRQVVTMAVAALVKTDLRRGAARAAAVEQLTRTLRLHGYGYSR